jgi:hypothetical protein
MQQFFHFIILTFIYNSTCFGRPLAHHQKLNNCSSSLWILPSERGNSSAVTTVVIAVLSPRSEG